MRNRRDLIRVSYPFSMRSVAFMFSFERGGIFPRGGSAVSYLFCLDDVARIPRSY